jgi:hypothetical protein
MTSGNLKDRVRIEASLIRLSPHRHDADFMLLSAVLDVTVQANPSESDVVPDISMTVS